MRNAEDWTDCVHLGSPGWVAKSLMLSAFPVFVFGLLVVRGLGRFGMREVTSFMVLMPLLVFACYYLVGWLIDRWKYKRPVET